MKKKLQIIGVIMVVLAILTILPVVWLDFNFWVKILITEGVIIALIFVFDEVTDKDED